MTDERQDSAELQAVLNFTAGGYLKSIFLKAETDHGQAILEKALLRVLNHGNTSWLRRLFMRG